ncbi:hypothetical protein [Streptomyces sp. NPDC002566]|uniref:hypothetical protein n=1 Tax=Streptomyces sp. NPDC002566 TaxID=3364650 RepID=UPI003696961F
MRAAATALVRHELRLLVSLWLWAARRVHGVGDGRAFGYARGQGAVTAGLAFVCGVETVAMSLLLRTWPTVHTVVLVLDLYTVFVVIGLYAAWRVRPHVLHGDRLRVRHAGHVDLTVPLERIAAVRHESRTTHEPAGDSSRELNLPVGSMTSVTLELTEPVSHVGFFGRRREVSVVRLHADDPGVLVREVREGMRRLGGTPYAGSQARPWRLTGPGRGA